MRAAGLRAGAGKPFAAERLNPYHRTNHRPVDINIPHPRAGADPRDRIRNSAVDSHGKSEAARIEFGNQYTALMKREWFSIGIHLGYMYEGSPIVVPDGTPQPPDEVSSYVPTARPGSRGPHVWLAEGKSTLDLFGKEFVLLCFGEAGSSLSESVSGLSEAAAARKVPFRAVEIDNEEARTLYERRLVLVRPDGQVAWRGDALPEDTLALIDTVRGAVTNQKASM